MTPMTPEERYQDLVEDFLAIDGVEGFEPPGGGSGFGRGALRYRRKIFAMFVRGQLVVKLPRQRVDALVADGHGDRFDANKGTPMKEWFTLAPGSALPWPELAREALEFARGGSLNPGKPLLAERAVVPVPGRQPRQPHERHNRWRGTLRRMGRRGTS
jgi:hypothetical protein